MTGKPQHPPRVKTASREPSIVSIASKQNLDGTLPSPTTAVVQQQQRWNHPRINVYRTLSTFWCFVVLGANDAALGALIPYLEEYYNLSYTVVSLVFLSPFVGYAASALLNNYVHHNFGQRGVGIIGPSAHMLAYIISSIHPPFPVLVVIYILAGFGNGISDAAWNAWISDMANANEVMGFLHGFYGLGATISPLIATTMITKGHLPWYNYYYLMIGFSFIELVFSSGAFWTATGPVYRASHVRTTDVKGNRMKEALFMKPSARITWLTTAFLIGYMGIEVGLGGWITTFMREIRHSSPFASGMTATGFWLGMTVGRVVLGFVTPRIGEKRAIIIYIPLAMALELCFWLIPQKIVSAVTVAIVGFLLGPLFPAAIVAVSRLLPKHLHVSAIGFAAAAGGGGAALFPFAVGAIAQAKGVGVLQPIVLALLVVILLLWLCLPRMGEKEE
ncbi:MFS general substrate transporter [Rhizodiscina lignyota]|uniref:MFS general substrate transporter n=1 Tax=Rhizodiscina lignyota TaxID=1504668 RepID=A0A9P4I421_9PEZI|nr:MFS general substrate transporter [Rhizodiscina lignyota]